MHSYLRYMSYIIHIIREKMEKEKRTKKKKKRKNARYIICHYNIKEKKWKKKKEKEKMHATFHLPFTFLSRWHTLRVMLSSTQVDMYL